MGDSAHDALGPQRFSVVPSHDRRFRHSQSGQGDAGSRSAKLEREPPCRYGPRAEEGFLIWVERVLIDSVRTDLGERDMAGEVWVDGRPPSRCVARLRGVFVTGVFADSFHQERDRLTTPE